MPGSSHGCKLHPCFEYYYGSENYGLAPDDIQEAVDLAIQVKKGAHMAIKNCINGLMGEEKEFTLPCDRQASNRAAGKYP